MSDKQAIKRKLQKIDTKPPVPARGSLLDVMWTETCQQEEEHRMALAFYVGWLVYGDTLRNWPKEIDPDTWRAAKKAFSHWFPYPQHIHSEHVELLLQLVSDPQNFAGAHTPQECWADVFGSCPYPEVTPATTEPETAPAIRPTRVSPIVPVTRAPGF